MLPGDLELFLLTFQNIFFQTKFLLGIIFDTFLKFMKIKAANAIAQIIRDNTYDALFMAAAKKNSLLIQETIRVIQSVKDQELTQYQLGHLCSFVTRLLKGMVFLLYTVSNFKFDFITVFTCKKTTY